MTRYSLKEMGLDTPIYDERALTQEDLRKQMGVSPARVKELVAARLASGEWVQVWRKSGGRSAKAYCTKARYLELTKGGKR